MEASRTAILAGHAWSRPMRMDASPGLIPAAITLTSTWPGPGTGRVTAKTSLSPYSSNLTASGTVGSLLR
jgi:hypothetical protein